MKNPNSLISFKKALNLREWPREILNFWESLKWLWIYLKLFFLSAQVDRRVYEKFWTKWRHQLIRKRVSELMMKHEEKKQLSEVIRGYRGTFPWFWRENYGPLAPVWCAGVLVLYPFPAKIMRLDCDELKSRRFARDARRAWRPRLD